MIEENKMFVTANTGSVILELAADKPAVKELWRDDRGKTSVQAANAWHCLSTAYSTVLTIRAEL